MSRALGLLQREIRGLQPTGQTPRT